MHDGNIEKNQSLDMIILVMVFKIVIVCFVVSYDTVLNVIISLYFLTFLIMFFVLNVPVSVMN